MLSSGNLGLGGGLTLLFIFLGIMIALFIYYYSTRGDDTMASNASPTTSTLTITENGATYTENYQIMPKREKYLQAAAVTDCYIDGITHPDYCSLHDRSTDGFAYIYDLSITSPTYSECPGGGHECWYKEKFDQNGNLVNVIDKNGVKLLDKLADDIWSNKWDMTNPNIAPALGMAEYKDDKLIALQDMPKADGTTVRAGSEITINDTPSKTVYFILLLISMKNAGKPKPQRIMLNVAGGKSSFTNFIAARTPPPATPVETPIATETTE